MAAAARQFAPRGGRLAAAAAMPCTIAKTPCGNSLQGAVKILDHTGFSEKLRG
jgi:hypothetical protein